MKTCVVELPNAEQNRIEATMDELAPRVLPAGWRLTEDYANCRKWTRSDKLSVIAEVESIDSELWFHVSMARPDRMPSYQDVRLVKALFVGSNRKAIQVLPATDEHVNLHPYCLHLFSPLDRDPLPDFRFGGQL